MSYSMIPMRQGSSSFGNSGLGGLGDVGSNALQAFMQSLKNAQAFYDYQDRQTLNPYYMQASAAGLDASAARNAGVAAREKTNNFVWNGAANSTQMGPNSYNPGPMQPGQGTPVGPMSFGQQFREDNALVPRASYVFPNYRPQQGDF